MSLRLYISLVVAAAIGSILYCFAQFPPTFSSSWLTAFATLIALAILGAALELRITEGGNTTSIDFVPQLAAILLLGTTGAIAVTAISQAFSEFLLLRKPRQKALFNTCQIIVSIAAASAVYASLGGEASLTAITFEEFGPFVVAVIVYFLLNTSSVSYAISLAEHEPFLTVWRQGPGPLILFDLVMSPLAFIVAFMYIEWNWAALLAAVLPIIGLRYSYGVNVELQQLNRDLLTVLIKTIEARDKYTSGHSLRVAERARQIAVAMRIKGQRLRTIETAALLHDIGKIDLAYGEILRQTGPLTPAQRELIRSHPDKGVAIVSSVRSIDPRILACIRHHHEWYNGEGYPSGIAREEIPLGARIIMVSDSIDAMMTDRPYRSALSLDEVRTELTRNSGTQFDPQVVQAAFAAGVVDEAPTYHGSQAQLQTSHRFG